MNALTFKTPYKSIQSLNSIDLPKFVVLTGRNGSGKTHLLESLRDGKVSSSLVQNIQADVVLYDWNNIIPNDTGEFDIHQHSIRRSTCFNQIKKQQQHILPNLQQQLIALGIPSELCSTIDKIRKLTKSKIQDHIEDSKIDTICEKIINIQKSSGQQIFNQAISATNNGDLFDKRIHEVINEYPELLLETSESNFFSNNKFLWGEVNPFQQAFARMFSTYRDLVHQNDRLEKYPSKDNSLEHLSSKLFIEEYGEPPWNFVNRIFEECELDFRVNSPPMHENGSFEPRLNKKSSDVEMKFSDLSSGEKVLMSFALCLYNASDARQKKRFPRLLLLDEVDAPLHPSMVVSLLKTIQSVLVDQEGISVILTTHSPSTVALTPEDSLYEMNPIGPRIEKCSKGKALSILTAGVPTLSISFEGRRQVFVESKTDANIYESLYQCSKEAIGSERSLSFIEVGHRPESGGEANAGCAQVKRIVNDLCDNGNESVFGLVDWDGNVSESERIKVLSPTIRNGLESALFDPVLLFALCVRNNIRFMRERGLVEDGETYMGLNAWDQERWQLAVNNLQALVLEEESRYNEDHLSIEYRNGMNLQISKDYLHFDDHKLEKRVVTVFGFLQPHNNHAGGLMRHIIETTLADMPGLLPMDVIYTYKRILGDEIPMDFKRVYQ